MIQLFLILCGSRLIRRRWWVLFLLGTLWMLAGCFLFLDALDGALLVPLIYFTIPLALDGVWTLISSFSSTGGGRMLRLVKTTVCFLAVILIILTPQYSGVTIGILVGLFLCLDAIWRGASAWMVRYNGWRRGLFLAGFEFLFGFWSFIPWPTAWEGEVGIDVGTLLIYTALIMWSLARRIRRLPQGSSILTVLNFGETAFHARSGTDAAELPERASRETVIVHVWTPTDTIVPVRRGVSRYVATVDKKGRVSTGHAALELSPDVYISHYPAVEIERSGAEFTKVLRADSDNDVPGLFQSSYAEESAEWCPSTARVSLPGLNGVAIRRFWRKYSADTTYNLTRRSCAGAVAKALDAGMDGLFEKKIHSPVFLLRLLMRPEFWVAGFMRQRAMAMTWTPGIALDYANALGHIVTVLGDCDDKRLTGSHEGKAP
jgi:uncharacterized membrane protein HdeD (DUF308 family)